MVRLLGSTTLTILCTVGIDYSGAPSSASVSFLARVVHTTLAHYSVTVHDQSGALSSASRYALGDNVANNEHYDLGDNVANNACVAHLFALGREIRIHESVIG